MLEFSDHPSDVNVLDSEYARLLGYPPGTLLTGRARELAEATRDWFRAHGRPWVYAREAGEIQLAAGRVQVAGVEFSSVRWQEQLSAAGADRAVLVAVSAGPECEARARELWLEGKPDEYFFTEVFGSAVVEHLVTTAGARLCQHAGERGLVVLPHYSPGYSGWDVADQNRLLALIRPAGGGLPGELETLESGMLRPKKSLLAVFGISRDATSARLQPGLIPCDNCSFAPCQYRRAPHRSARPQVEDVRKLQGQPEATTPAASSSAEPLNLDAKYSLNARALRKWAQERLRLQFTDDGGVRARFVYEGTTCSNQGRPLAYEYGVTLSPAADGYRVLAARCAPVAGDVGHTFMCAYLTDAARFTRELTNESPLLGQPLDDVLAWQRSYSPSACYCDASGRAHKWGLVYEVVHFALVQRAREKLHGHFGLAVK